MASRGLLAFFLVLLMVLSGCTSNNSGFPEDFLKPQSENDDVENINPNLTIDGNYWNVESGAILTLTGLVSDEELNEVTISIEIIDYGNVIVPDTITWDIDPSGGLYVSLILSESGIYSIFIRAIDGHNASSEIFYGEIFVENPKEDNTQLYSMPIIEIASPEVVVISGIISHTNIETCKISTTDVSNNLIEITPPSDGAFSLDIGFVEDDSEFYINATCGEWSVTNSSIRVRVFVEDNGTDLDGDGVVNEFDSCPEGMGSSNGWTANNETDMDGDGCHDGFEDPDDDSDGIIDSLDNCPQGVILDDLSEYDYDGDGCHDEIEDLDDDGDGINDGDDQCTPGAKNWPSTFSTDWDQDGCRDIDEDEDDDSDGYNDAVDQCPTGGVSHWAPTENNDWDGDACHDDLEDPDDDNDGVNDINATGYILDECPQTALNSTDIDEKGCAPYQRDSDNDGLTDDIDQCPGTPFGYDVNEIGCADIDGDGVFENIDSCENTPQRWTPDSTGCSVQQYSEPWNTGPYGSDRLDVVSSFSVPTLSGTWNFQNEWTGDDVYLFLFKYTDSNGNSNSATWGANPRDIILNLPDNAHLFYGSFDTSYHSDVTSRQTDVQNRLSANEEAKWMSRVHFIDQRGFDIGGGLGSLISNWQTFYYGIDRFQQSREIGSLHDWSQGTSCCTKPMHFSFEPHTWNYEFESTKRTLDYGATVVTIFGGDWHSGGWGSGMNSYSNATFPNASTMSDFDTMEVYAYNPCDEHRQRYGKSDGSYGGCHEWDYLHHLRICDANNSSICGTEFVRYITTYGREGRWVTDITPYLWMLEDGGERRFRYTGASKMGLHISVLLFNWNESKVPTSSEFAFAGGQFRGEYNNESQYKRSHIFTIPPLTTKVEIVATITGHGFGQDSENCAEFCNHEHHYYLDNYHAMEGHSIVKNGQGCTTLVNEGVVANQFGSWPYGRAGWCPGQDVKQWRYDITSWVDMSGENNLTYRGLFNGQEYVPQNDQGGSRNIQAVVWIVFYSDTI